MARTQTAQPENPAFDSYEPDAEPEVHEFGPPPGWISLSEGLQCLVDAGYEELANRVIDILINAGYLQATRSTISFLVPRHKQPFVTENFVIVPRAAIYGMIHKCLYSGAANGSARAKRR